MTLSTSNQPISFFDLVEAIEKKMSFIENEGVRGMFALSMASHMLKGMKWENAFDKAIVVVAPFVKI